MGTEVRFSAEHAWKVLQEIKDPEIPVVSVVELGIAREVTLEDTVVVVTITPTFLACPAVHVMKAEIRSRLEAEGYAPVEVRTRLDPPWSSDWISEEGQSKLRGFGIAPPRRHGGAVNVVLDEAVVCPYCGSTSTTQKNPFGPTACRAIYYCDACRQPFERFKPM